MFALLLLAACVAVLLKFPLEVGGPIVVGSGIGIGLALYLFR